MIEANLLGKLGEEWCPILADESEGRNDNGHYPDCSLSEKYSGHFKYSDFFENIFNYLISGRTESVNFVEDFIKTLSEISPMKLLKTDDISCLETCNIDPNKVSRTPEQAFLIESKVECDGSEREMEFELIFSRTSSGMSVFVKITTITPNDDVNNPEMLVSETTEKKFSIEPEIIFSMDSLALTISNFIKETSLRFPAMLNDNDKMRCVYFDALNFERKNDKTDNFNYLLKLISNYFQLSMNSITVSYSDGLSYQGVQEMCITGNNWKNPEISWGFNFEKNGVDIDMTAIYQISPTDSKTAKFRYFGDTTHYAYRHMISSFQYIVENLS